MRIFYIAKWHKNATLIFHLRRSCVRKAASVRRAATGKPFNQFGGKPVD